MAKQAVEKIGGTEYVLQSVSPEAYLDNHDRFGRGKNTKRYMDWLIRNVVVSPPEIAAGGLDYFNKRADVGGAGILVEAIETFLGKPVEPEQGARTGQSPE